MKNTLKAVLVIVMLAAAPYAWSQANLKIGHIDSQALIELMPQKDSVEAQLISYQQSLEEQIGAMYLDGGLAPVMRLAPSAQRSAATTSS